MFLLRCFWYPNQTATLQLSSPLFHGPKRIFINSGLTLLKTDKTYIFLTNFIITSIISLLVNRLLDCKRSGCRKQYKCHLKKRYLSFIIDTLSNLQQMQCARSKKEPNFQDIKFMKTSKKSRDANFRRYSTAKQQIIIEQLCDWISGTYTRYEENFTVMIGHSICEKNAVVKRRRYDSALIWKRCKFSPLRGQISCSEGSGSHFFEVF